MAVVASDRGDPCAHAVKNELKLCPFEIKERAPYHVLRLLAGAKVNENKEQDCIILSICGNDYMITSEALEFYNRVADRIKREELEAKGFSASFNTEDVCFIFNHAGKVAAIEYGKDPKMLRVFFYLADYGGCGFYRIIQPSCFFNKDKESLIYSEYGDGFSHNLGKNFDVIVYPRLGDPWAFSVLRALKNMGKVVIFETDDLLSSIPDWNPAKHAHHAKENLWREKFIKECDGLIVSTEELKSRLGREDRTYVCHNGVDEKIWPMVVKEQVGVRESKEKGEKIGILWAGSKTHSKDLAMIAPVIKRLIRQFPETLHVYFVGSVPTEFLISQDVCGVLTAEVCPQFRNNISFVHGVNVFQYPQLLASLPVHIALAPLVECEFNECKSEIKVLEAWALGLPMIASRIAPYSRAIKHNVNGLLIGPNQNDWYYAIESLIANPAKRTEFAKRGLETLREKYMMTQIRDDYERALLLLARGRTVRKECNAAIQKRLEEKKWL